MIYLVDCNNFFVSCERLFNPALCNRPVVVLSSNDGCVVSRSPEAKALGIGMGQPFFEIEALAQRHNVEIISSNFLTYSDISQRIMQRLDELVEQCDIYSIDEAFLTIRRFTAPKEHIVHARLLRTIILKEIGIPVSIGIGPTKVLAKLATEYAKKDPQSYGVAYLTGTQQDDDFLSKVPVHDIWGIGRRYAALLTTYQIKTAHDFKYADRHWIQRRMTVIGVKMLLEMNGEPCISIEEAAPQQIICSRSFGERVTSLLILKQAVTQHVTKACRRLRKNNCAARGICIHISTGKHSTFSYSKKIYLELPAHTQYTPHFIAAAHQLLEKIYQQGYAYKKSGVMLYDFVDQNEQQESFLSTTTPPKTKQQAFMAVLDRLQQKWGERTVFIGPPSFRSTWQPRSQKRSPNYVDSWAELPRVKAQ